MTLPRSRVPPAYPTELMGDLRLADGRVIHVRPILPADGRWLAEAVKRADPETIRLRFLGARPPLDEKAVRHLVEVDYRWRLALVALGDGNKAVAIARYEGSAGNSSAEVAIVVDREWRRLGLGTALLVLLALRAAASGIRRFTATYLSDNTEVSRLVAKSGLPHSSSISRGVTETAIELTSLKDDVVDPVLVAQRLLAHPNPGPLT